jgi:hypothetical protein
MSALVALLKGRLEGMLTAEEFENAKKQLLAEAAPPPSAAAPATPSLLPETRSTSGGDIPASHGGPYGHVELAIVGMVRGEGDDTVQRQVQG